MTRNIDLPPLTRAADLLPASIDAAERTIEVVWSTGARVRRNPFFGDPFDEELAMDPRAVRLDRLNAGAPLLKVHDASVLDSIIGSVVPGSARIENGRGVARVRFSDRTEVEPLWKDVEAGHIRAVSIGYQVHRFEVTKQAGAPELWRAVDWTPFEISAVPIGADPAAGFRSDEPLHPCVVHRADAPTQEKAAMDDAVTDNAETHTRQAAPEAQDRVSNTPLIDAEAIAARARDSERERVGTIYDLAGRLHLERSFADDLVKRGDARRCAQRDARQGRHRCREDAGFASGQHPARWSR
jgi:Caudovirus prohead protease.